ncbi:hypothetical protein LQZ21_09130 [Treponema sp. TIM-1]|uniref:hypothetical protein n=1 Tax=Treponema sp. TIM-1 TaxID=2898417 RepID=UPI00397F83D3
MVSGRKARGILALALVFGVTALGFSFDVKSFPSPIKKGSILISGGFGLGIYILPLSDIDDSTSSSVLLGGTLAVDYALPINFALTVGGEIGYSGSKLDAWDSDVDISLGEIPIIVRAAWHPNWEVKNLDTYLLVKVGYGIGLWTGDDIPDGVKIPHGIIAGFNIGVRYFFVPAFGAFVETGYEYHMLRFKEEDSSITYTYTSIGSKFVTLGVTFRL